MSAADITSAWQPAILDKLVSSLSLQSKEYAVDLGFDTFDVNGASGTVVSYEGAGKPNVAWLSGLTLSDGSDVARCSLTAWVGPLSDVPHLMASCGVADGAVTLSIDFPTRAECAYEPSGVYEEPTTREAFAMGGNRKDFAAAFYTEDLIAWRDGLLGLPGAQNSPLSAEEMAAQSASPLYLDLRLPLTDDSATAAAAACVKASEAWLEWMLTSTEKKRDLPAGAKQTQVYARDTKLKTNAYGMLLRKYTSAYGEAGTGLAAADAGPLDEAYVGGGS